MEPFDYTLETLKTFDEAVEAVVAECKDLNFGVLHIHDVQATLAAKGFRRGPLKIIEVCNAKHAYDVLEKDVKISLMLPCPISVYVEKEKTTISALRPRMMSAFYPQAGIETTAEAVDAAILAIVDGAK
jgi:uncharacterized protein (DUF302 family)